MQIELSSDNAMSYGEWGSLQDGDSGDLTSLVTITGFLAGFVSVNWTFFVTVSLETTSLVSTAEAFIS